MAAHRGGRMTAPKGRPPALFPLFAAIDTCADMARHRMETLQ